METGWFEYSKNQPAFEQGIDYTKAEFFFPADSSQKGGQKINFTKRQEKVTVPAKGATNH